MNLLSGAEIYCPLSVLERVRITDFFLKKIYENFIGTLETARIREVSGRYREVNTIQFSICF